MSFPMPYANRPTFPFSQPYWVGGWHVAQMTLAVGNYLLLPFCLGSGPVAISGGPEADEGT